MKQADVMGWGLMARPPVTYLHGQRPDDGKRRPEDMSSGEVRAFLLRSPWVTTRSAKVQRCLAFLDLFRPDRHKA